MKYRLNGAQHVDENGKSYSRGDLVETDLDLINMFPNKFARFYKEQEEEEGKNKGKKGKKRKKEKKLKKKLSKVKKAEEVRGTEVTKTFPSTKGEALQVFQRGAWYHVYEKDDVKPLNEKGLKKAKVQAFLKNYLDN